MSKLQTASTQITEQVSSWPGVTAGPGRRGELAFKVGGREIGHLHGDQAAHFAFPKQVWRELREQGRIEPHPVFPGKEGMASRRIADADDVRDVIELMRLNYERSASGHRRVKDARFAATEALQGPTKPPEPAGVAIFAKSDVCRRGGLAVAIGSATVTSAPSTERD